MILSTTDDPIQTWRLRGKPLGVALAVTLVLLAGVLAAAAYDISSPLQRRPFLLEMSALAGKLVATVGLLVLAKRTASSSLRWLAWLVGLLAVAGLLADTEAADVIADGATTWLVDWIPLSEGVIHNALFFGALAVAATALLVAAYLTVEESEKQVVSALIVLIVLVGVFVGPVNAIAALGINREWLFAEDFGQAVFLAVMAGYVWGLVAANRERSVDSAEELILRT